MKKVFNEKFHPEFDRTDLPAIESSLGENKFEEFLNVESIANTSACKYPRLSKDGYRKLKFHSAFSPNPVDKSDMRLIYRFNKKTNTLEFLSAGKRYSVPNFYNQANARDDNSGENY